ncbi:PEPxxWA-CTERM sorting domain-containing protein [Polymorphobacter megasporae]|uniref:PEPxxWA-CTERM sorting domain-containing protein n=1 Tax=Glacieibacterium megasporae TaxID=2835787 RepID=UPI002106A17E|nr:PEPxxWA-CTERM sorting domain-containing protein [Polymorphobacter megasporae]
MKILFVSMLLVSAASAGASTLYSQSATSGGAAYASQNDTSGTYGYFAVASDDFTLGSSARITTVDFVGAYFVGAPSTITAFTLTFSADSASAPGATLYSTKIAGNAGESLTGVVGSYSAAVDFAATGGTKYWLSIVPDLTYPPSWGWAAGNGGNGTAYQVFFGESTALPTDLAFSLEGGAVPEPAGWTLMIGGFGLVGTALRRRRPVAA